MSGIAELLVNLGHVVSGSDLSQGQATRRLAEMGARICKGHHASNVEEVHAVVTSSAISPDNPEVKEACRRHIPVIRRAEMLAELMRLKYGLAVAGAHGKTTCTSMLASIMATGKLDPTVVVGGRVGALGSNAWLGKGEFLVAEADESDGSFNILTPVVVVVTNVDREHMDHYGSEEALDQAFVQFMNKVPFYGAAVICLDDPRLAGLIPKVRKPQHHLRPHLPGPLSGPGFTARDRGHRFHPLCGRPGSGALFGAGAGQAQCAQFPGGYRGRPGGGSQPGRRPPGPGRFRRGAAAI